MDISTRAPVFHVGFPKAGSTTLQRQVFPYMKNAEGIRKLYELVKGDLGKYRYLSRVPTGKPGGRGSA